jgi:hypothetical protein
MRESADDLVLTARLLVEALIERKVTEAELVAAHNDPEADASLLSRLTAKGLDAADADPLFDDLARLCELIDEATQRETG